MALADKMPVFVSKEARVQGLVFQRVVIDPSALNAVKHEIVGKFTWIASTAPEFSPAQHTGAFWRLVRRFMPTRQAIADVNIRLEQVVVRTSAVSSQGAVGFIYARKRIKLPVLSLPLSIPPAPQFCESYDLPLYLIGSDDALA